ncbi:MAG TPA: hypothetical protein VEJ63_23855 [Planctomycetota bacterium]|nr:hypothetical protein [Planctomycetota bacterium]
MNQNLPIPMWQQLSGLTREAEPKMSDEQRDEAIRALLKKADELAAAEYSRAAPEGERSFIWNPIERICFRLGIARSKLSAYCRELTGLSAYEWADRYPAKALTERIREWAGSLLSNLLDRMKRSIGNMRSLKEDFKVTWRERALNIVRDARKGAAKICWASALKFANLARLRRACLMTHGVTIEELEERTVHQLVQKFFDELEEHMKGLPEPPPPRYLFTTGVETEKFVRDFGFMPKSAEEVWKTLQARRDRENQEAAEKKRQQEEKARQERQAKLEQAQEEAKKRQQGEGGGGGLGPPPPPLPFTSFFQ